MPKFKNGTHVNGWKKDEYKRLRISAGPFRGKYVDVLILEAKLGRKLLPGYTCEHIDGDTMNIDHSNLIEVTEGDNTRRMHDRRKQRGEYSPGVSFP